MKTRHGNCSIPVKECIMLNIIKGIDMKLIFMLLILFGAIVSIEYIPIEIQNDNALAEAHYQNLPNIIPDEIN